MLPVLWALDTIAYRTRRARRSGPHNRHPGRRSRRVGCSGRWRRSTGWAGTFELNRGGRTENIKMHGSGQSGLINTKNNELNCGPAVGQTSLQSHIHSIYCQNMAPFHIFDKQKCNNEYIIGCNIEPTSADKHSVWHTGGFFLPAVPFRQALTWCPDSCCVLCEHAPPPSPSSPPPTPSSEL